MRIRAYRDADAPLLMRLFHATVHEVCRADYPSAALEAWAPAAGLDPDVWRTRFARTRPWVAVAEDDDAPVGFLELDADGHIDCCYAHHRWQRRGVGTLLLGHALALAARARFPRLTADVSITARPFFARHGFAVVRAQDVRRNGETLRNFVMERVLAPKESSVTSPDAFRRAIERHDFDELIALFREDAVLHSPITFQPFEGKAAIRRLLGIIFEVFEDFHYTDELDAADGMTKVLVFRTKVKGRDVEGIDMVRFDDAGMVRDLTVMVRPRSALERLLAEVQPRLMAAIQADAAG
jgi:putative acetyltransferase